MRVAINDGLSLFERVCAQDDHPAEPIAVFVEERSRCKKFPRGFELELMRDVRVEHPAMLCFVEGDLIEFRIMRSGRCKNDVKVL